MTEKNTDTDAFVAQQSKRMMSAAMYHKLKFVVDRWDREERGKAKVVAGAAYALVAWIALVIVGALFLPSYIGWFVPAGFLIWLIIVVNLMRKQLDATRGKASDGE